MDFTDLKKWVTESWKAQGAWREQAENDFAFIDGHQWTDEEAAQMKEANRLPVVFNRTAVLISSVAGSEINNRTEVRFIPREIGDVKANEVLSAGGEWFRDQANAEDADSEAFQNMLVCGMGVTDTGLDFDEDPEGAPTVTSIDPLSFGWDSYAKKRGLTDARYFFEVKEMAVSDAKERFPGKTTGEIHAGWLKNISGAEKTTTHADDEYTHGETDSEELRDTVFVVRMQYRTREKFVEYMDPMQGEKAEMPASKWAQIERLIPVDVPHRKFTKSVWRQVFLGATDILDTNHPDPDGPTFSTMTGAWDRKLRMFYGLLRTMREPQRYANKWLSTTMHIIASNAKGGVVAEAGAVPDPAQFEESWAAADSVTWVNDGRMAGIQEKPKPQIPGALMALTEFAVSTIRDVSGVNMELLGMRDATQPGVLEYQRKQSAMTTLARYFDALRFYRKRQGGVILNMLRHHIAPTGRLVRILKDGEAQYVPLAMDDATEKYDVIVDDAPQAPNEKEKAWSVVQAMMPLLQGAGLSLDDWADILEYSPLPSSFVEKVRQKAADQAKQGPDPMQQLQLEMAQAELAKVQSAAVENAGNAQLDAARTQKIIQETGMAPALPQIPQ